MFDLHEVERLCTGVLSSKLNQNNMLQLLQMAIDFQNESLKSQCLKKFQENTRAIVESPQFLDASHEVLYALMSSEEVTNCREADLFIACRSWARADCRRQHIPVASGEEIRNALGDILLLVRFQDFQLKELKFARGVLETSDELALLQFLSLPEHIRKEADCNPAMKTECKVKHRNVWSTPQTKVLSQHIPRIRCKNCQKHIDTDVGCEWVCCAECPTANFCIPCVLEPCHQEHMTSLHVFVNRGFEKHCSLCGADVSGEDSMDEGPPEGRVCTWCQQLKTGSEMPMMGIDSFDLFQIEDKGTKICQIRLNYLH